MLPDCEIHGAQCGREWQPENGQSLEAAQFSPKFAGLVIAIAIHIVCERNFISLRKLAEHTMLSYSVLWRLTNGAPINRPRKFDQIMVQLVIFEQERLQRIHHA